MNVRRLILATMVGLTVAGMSQAFDSVKTAKNTLLGKILGMGPVNVQLEQNSAGTTKETDVPVNQIQTIFFDNDPAELKKAKTHVIDGHYAEGQVALERIRDEPDQAVIQQDIEFYKALCAAKLALAGNGKIADAGRSMKAFADANPKSYHYFEASEIVGDLLVAIRQYGQAADYYARLTKAPWPDYQMRAGVAEGRAFLAQGKIDDAQSAFDRVVATKAEGDLAQEQRTLAQLGKASALVAAKKPDEAVKMVEDILKTANPDDAPLLARGYNVLGNAYRQAGDPKRALLAFLHVDLLYPTVADAHAEALANLAELWEQVHKSDRASRARKTLIDNYKDSPWAGGKAEGGERTNN